MKGLGGEMTRPFYFYIFGQDSVNAAVLLSTQI